MNEDENPDAPADTGTVNITVENPPDEGNAPTDQTVALEAIAGRIEAVEDGPERLAMLRRNRPDETIPLRRAGNVEDIADAVAALVSDDMRYVTGQCLHVNGGIYMD